MQSVLVATERRRMPLCLCVCVSTVNFSPLFSLNLILYCCLAWTQFFETPHEKLKRLTKVCSVTQAPSTVPKSMHSLHRKRRNWKKRFIQKEKMTFGPNVWQPQLSS